MVNIPFSRLNFSLAFQNKEMVKVKRKRYFGRKDNVEKNKFFEEFMLAVSEGKIIVHQLFISLFIMVPDSQINRKSRSLGRTGSCQEIKLRESLNFPKKYNRSVKILSLDHIFVLTGF